MILNIVDFLKSNKYLVMTLLILIMLIFVLLLWYIKNKTKKTTVKEVSIIGIFTGFSIVLYFIKFNIPIFPPFLEIHFSLLPIIIAGFMMSPTHGILIVLLRTIIKMFFTTTFCVGEIADFIIGVSVVGGTSLIYKKYHTKKGALVSLLVGIITWVVVGCLSNYFVNIPFYIQLYCNGEIEMFIQYLSVIPGITKENYLWRYIVYACIPFNLILSVMVNLITFLVYKKISILFHKIEY